MFGFAAALAMVACAEVESSNIVGYQQYEPVVGMNLFSPMFTGTDGKALNIQNIVLKNAQGWGTDCIQFISSGGKLGEKYIWVNADMAPSGAGWYLTDFRTKVTELDYSIGDGFYIGIALPETYIETSGGVRLEALSKPLSVGMNVVGNSTPNAINIQDIKMKDAQGWGTDCIQVITSGGKLGSKYIWVNADIAPNGAGWYLPDFTTKVTDVTFAPGEGLYVGVALEGTSLELPPAINE